MVFDVCILGHITRDLIQIPGRLDQEQAGGTAFYAAVTLSGLGLDAQGLLRRISDGAVELGGMQHAKAVLRHACILKVDDEEAMRITGEPDPEASARNLEALGAREVLVTFADRGSLLRAGGRT